MLVERRAYDRALQIARSVAESTKVAPAHMSGRHLGPVVNKQQWDQIQVCKMRAWCSGSYGTSCTHSAVPPALYSTNHVQGYIQTGIDEGARLVAGGLGLPEGLTKGYFVRPTVFADVKSGMTIEKEEIFGPVLCIMPFDDEADALRIANETPYGLTNYVRQSMCVC